MTRLITARDAEGEALVQLRDEMAQLSGILAEVIRHLRPDLVLLHADDDMPMVADLVAEFGPEGLIEELLGYP
ncbi:MAG: hypothetical protein F6K42_24825 [Leptolyngbya sp. SIO1D8]|nr:hypothetical protein [Leptolyngbya sp. SIO1D8]